MTDHLTSVILSALADGELTAQQLAQVNDHLAACSACTTQALQQSLLKSATAKAGRRYAPPSDLQATLTRLTANATLRPEAPRPTPGSPPRFGLLGWAAAAAVLLAFAVTLFVQRNHQSANLASVRNDAQVTEVFDQHVATLAGNQPPQVISTDRHTVKPWFQGKLPFSFNLPDNLPADTTLDGANLAYLHDQPVAQLLYSIGRHRVSVFVRQKSAAPAADPNADRAGFHVITASAGELEITAISDVDPARLTAFVATLRQAQTPH